MNLVMPHFNTITRINAQQVRSLVWDEDVVIDWAGGGACFHLDGTTDSRAVNFAYRFDAACNSPSRQYAAIYERLGTKGLVLREGQILREINRSFYHADVYEYPIAFATLKSGREVLIHCPEDYNQLEIDDVETGARLTQCEDRKPFDFFHSRLAVHHESGLCLSAGWVWHPFDAMCLYDLEAAIENPKLLDDSGVFPIHSTEISAATFIDDDHLVIATSSESFEDEEYEDNELRPSSLSVWNVKQARIVSQVSLTEPTGTLMAVSKTHVVSFYDHPKIIDIRTGEIEARMDDVPSGKQTSSIIHHLEPIPPLALDPTSRRFAIASGQEIVIAEIED